MIRQDRRSSRRVWLRVVRLSAVAGGLVIGGAFAFERWSLVGWESRVTTETRPVDPFLKFAMPGIVRPATVAADRSTLDPDELVIGVIAGGRARAYRLEALRDRSRHVVNDVVGELPVSVAFCDLDHCVRGYAGKVGEGPLDVSVAGLLGGREMILEVGGSLYFQNSGESYGTNARPRTLPLDRIEPTLTTWKAWKHDHPQTDVYEGVR